MPSLCPFTHCVSGGILFSAPRAPVLAARPRINGVVLCATACRQTQQIAQLVKEINDLMTQKAELTEQACRASLLFICLCFESGTSRGLFG